jgi:phenolic acid decarboxylase
VTITGQNFDANSYVAIGNAPGKPESQSVTPTSYTATSLTFVVPAYGISVGAAYPNPLYVAETNSSLVSNEATLTVSAAPYISQVNPTTVAPGATVTVTGQNFDSNSYISIGNVPTGPESEPLAVTSQTATSLTFPIPSNMSPATFPIYVAEHNSSLVSNEGSITIAAMPTITGINPNQGTATTNVTISGYNLTSGGNPLIQFYGSNGTLAGTIYFINMNYISAQSITFNPNATSVALTPGTYQVDVVTPNGTSNSMSFTLNAAPVAAMPTITGINPNQGTATTNVTISGYNLTSGGNPLIQFYGSNGTLAGTIYFINMNYISAQSITFNPNATSVALTPGTYQVDVVTPNGTSNSMSFTLNAAPVANPVINSFSVNASQQFSLAAYNYNTITFQAQCGNFVDVLRSPDWSSVSYPTGSASICNAPQTYSSSSFNEDPSMAAQMVNVPLSLYNAQGIVDDRVTYVGNPAGSNNSGSAMLTVNVCNTANVCVHQTASFPIYAKACLAAGTTISMADGSYKDIEDVKVGDVVKSSNGSAKVAKVVQQEDPIITINGILKAAPDEIIYLASGKTETANQIKIGDQLLSENGQATTVTTITQSNEMAKTYDLVLENGNTFFADGYLVQALNTSE